MKRFCIAFVTVIFANAAASLGAVQSKTVQYNVGGQTFQGYLAWDEDVRGPRPAVIVIHEWWGNDDYAKRRADQLAMLGYTAFAIDMYGGGRTTDDPKQAEQWAGELRKNPDRAKARLQAALDALKQQPTVNPRQIAAIGYCFGGTMALNMARWNMGVAGVVSFHGDLTDPDPKDDPRIGAKILVLTGAADEWVPPQQVEAFKQEMAAAGAEFDVIAYPDADHSFTNPDADHRGMENISYNKDADEQSWQEMMRFFEGLFGK